MPAYENPPTPGAASVGDPCVISELSERGRRGHGRPWCPLTFDGDDELRDDGEDLAPAVLQHVMDPLPGEELVGKGHLAEPVEKQGQVVVVVQLLDLHLQGHRTGRCEPRAGQSQASRGPRLGEPALPASGGLGQQFPRGPGPPTGGGLRSEVFPS